MRCVCVVSQVSNHKQLIRLLALQVGDRKVCSLANFNFGDGSHNGWSIAAGYEPLPCSLVSAAQKFNILLCITAASYNPTCIDNPGWHCKSFSTCLQEHRGKWFSSPPEACCFNRTQAEVCRESAHAQGTNWHESLVPYTCFLLPPVASLNAQSVDSRPGCEACLSHTPVWALCTLHWSFSFNPSGLICHVHPCLLQLSTWLLSTDLLPA